MNSIETLATFFGWCTVINLGILLVFMLLMSIMNKDGFLVNYSVKVFGNTKEETWATLFQVFQQYRLLFIVFNVVPYIALKIMT